MPAEKTYRLDAFELVPPSRAILSAGELQPLRPKVFDVLLYLVENRERVVGKEELLQAFWPGMAVTDDSLVQCIGEIRRILGDNPREPKYVRTVSKLGYQFVGSVQEVQAAPNGSSPEPVVMSPQPRRARPAVLLACSLVALSAAALAWMNLAKGKPPAGVPLNEVAWWKLDETDGSIVHDAARKQLNGTLRGGRWVQGKMRGGLALNGQNAFVMGSANGVLPSGSASRTISLWMKPDLPVVEAAGLFEYGSDLREFNAERFGLHLRLDGRISFDLSNDHGAGASGSRWDDGAWHMVTAIYQGPPANLAALFVDGRLDKTEHFTTLPATNGRGVWRIGQVSAESTSYRGMLNDVRVYARALSAQEVMALYRCMARVEDLAGYYYLPISYAGVVVEERTPGDPSAPFRQDGKDYSGIQLARSDGTCAIDNLEGADVGQDLRISADLLVPADDQGRTTDAGAYFRSRRAYAGDGIAGGTSAGYEVQVSSSGILKVYRLNPFALLAFTDPIPGFDAAVFHRLELEAKGEALRVWLDGEVISFRLGDQRAASVPIPQIWNRSPRAGNNQGAAGIMFGAANNRGQAGGQRVRNLRVAKLQN